MVIAHSTFSRRSKIYIPVAIRKIAQFIKPGPVRVRAEKGRIILLASQGQALRS